MRKYTRVSVQLALLAAVVLSTVLSGCGAIDAAKQVADVAKELATQAPNVAKELQTQVPQQLGGTPTKAATAKPGSTPAATAKPGATPTEEATQLENTFDNLMKLAPVHIASSFVSKKDNKVVSSMSYEADLDAAGNQHLKMTSNSGPVEIYSVGGKMYIGTGDGQFIAAGDAGGDLNFLAMYGGAFLLAYNDLQDAKLVGTEAVGTWQAKKYQINMNLGSLGVAGLAAGTQGAQWQYQGFAWIEPTKGALVKALVDWSGKAVNSTVTESYHSEFLASKGTVTEIKPPANVVSLGS